MKNTKNIKNLVRTSLSALFIGTVFVLTSCSDQEALIAEPTKPAEVVEEVATEGEGESASVTVSGAFIEYSDGKLCSECTYVVPENATVVDGAKLGIKAGDVICLNSAFKYNAVEVVNVEGTSAEPVIVANCGE
jgi:hypothetical protein